MEERPDGGVEQLQGSTTTLLFQAIAKSGEGVAPITTTAPVPVATTPEQAQIQQLLRVVERQQQQLQQQQQHQQQLLNMLQQQQQQHQQQLLNMLQQQQQRPLPRPVKVMHLPRDLVNLVKEYVGPPAKRQVVRFECFSSRRDYLLVEHCERDQVKITFIKRTQEKEVTSLQVHNPASIAFVLIKWIQREHVRKINVSLGSTRVGYISPTLWFKTPKNPQEDEDKLYIQSLLQL